jgi:hypothetical protein
MTNRLRVVILAAVVAAAGGARADTIQASSTTMLLGRQDYREGSLQTAVPLYELLSISASDIRTPYADNLEVALSTWGAVDLANNTRFWQNGAPTGSRFTGDVNAGYVRGDFFGKVLTLKLGREMVADGVARMVQIDGGEVRLNLPAGFGVSGYVGSPVAPRFMGRGGELQTGNAGAELALGGRASWRYASLLEVGASVAAANDHGDVVRRDVGADLRITPVHYLTLVTSGFYSLWESRIGEALVALQLAPVHGLDVTVDYRHVEPDLFLGRNSILSVFVSDNRNDVGGLVHWAALPTLALDGDYHFMIEQDGNGHQAKLKGTWRPCGPKSSLGAEAGLLKNAAGTAASITGNGYAEARVFGATAWREILFTADLLGYFYDHSVNGEAKALSATGTAGYEFARGWRAALAGTVGSTPFLERQFEIMAKLVYEQTYAVREVR